MSDHESSGGSSKDLRTSQKVKAPVDSRGRSRKADDQGAVPTLMPQEASYSASHQVAVVEMLGNDSSAAIPRTITRQGSRSMRAAKAGPDVARSSRRTGESAARKRTRNAPEFFAAGFWRRAAGALIDLAIIVPVVALMYLVVSKAADISVPSSRHHGVDFWLDLLLEGDPALITLVGLLLAIATIYVLVFQIILSRTPGMRIMKLRIIDQYGEPPSTARAAARTSGYLASAATLGLGFIWIGFDSEKRGLHDWLSGTYVVRA